MLAMVGAYQYASALLLYVEYFNEALLTSDP